jgi:hypothetical protein
MKSKYDKTKMIYCYNEKCSYHTEYSGNCIITHDVEWESICPIKDVIHKFGNDLEKINYVKKED